MLVGTPVFAADMALKAPPPPPFSWTGFYIGGELGGAWANGHVNDSLFGLNVSSNHDGWLGGAVVGYNYQTSNVVFGIEGDFDWTSLNATGNGVFIPGVGTLQASAKTNWITTVAGRVGCAADRTLFYVKGGGGWVGNSASITNLTTGLAVNVSNTRTGYDIGGGVEYAFTDNWTGRIEYRYYNFGSANTPWVDPAFRGGSFFRTTLNDNVIRVGLAYKFGAPPAPVPVVAKY